MGEVLHRKYDKMTRSNIRGKELIAERKAKGICVNCGKEPPLPTKFKCDRCWHIYREYYKKADIKRKVAQLQHLKDKRQELKLAIFEAYGGVKCNCCGNTRKECLQVDHINGGGCKHLKSFPSNNSFYGWLKKSGYPEGFQILCANCNWIKRFVGTCDCQTYQRETIV